MLQRRGFLGSVIGSFMAGNFFARLETEPFQFEEIKKYPYRILLRESVNNKIIQATPIVDIVPTAYGWQLVAGAFDCRQTLTMEGSIVIDDRGRKIAEGKFCSSVSTVNGDQLRVTHTLDANPRIGIQTIDELCQIKLNPAMIKALDKGDLITVQEFLQDYRSKKNV